MTLPKTLLANAALSFVTGLLLSVAPGTVGDWLGVSIDGWLRLLGLALLGHGAVLVWAASREPVAPLAKLNFAMIAPYPLMMIGVVVAGLVDSSGGRALVLLDGTLVGLLAIAHWVGLRTNMGEAHPVPA